MALYRLLQNSAFLPEDIERMVDAYESILADLNLPRGDHPLNQTIAVAIIECAQTGEKNPLALRIVALSSLGRAA